MQIKFWGTRGSIAKPGPGTARYGGNTSCTELRSDSGALVVIDCGTGGHGLGQHLLKDGKPPVNGHLLISHTHWDHIQGIPFFAPLFVPGNTWDVYGPKGLSQSLQAALSGQMEHTYFPVALEHLTSTIRYHDLVEGSFDIGDIRITTRYLNHPALTLGYRFEVDGASLVYCCDHEPHSAAMASGACAIAGVDRHYADFVAGADLVIHDAQYTAGEYPAKVGWGHSPVEYAVRVCLDAGVKRVLLTHHDPLRDDAAIDRIVARVRADLARDGAALVVDAAAEGMRIELRGLRKDAPRSGRGRFLADTAIDKSSFARPVLLHVADAQMLAMLTEAVASEGLPFLVVENGGDLPRKVLENHPALVLLEHNPPQMDALRLVSAIRAVEPAEAVKVPLVLVATAEQSESARDSAATDWLVAPFSPSYVRTKIRAWALRAACRWIRAEIPFDENRRLSALRDLEILDTPPEERFDRVTRLACAAFNVPIALVSLVDGERQWFKSRVGLNVGETPRDFAFCAHVVQRREELIVQDTLLDGRFAENPLVTQAPRARFYAGAPLILDDGSCVGTVCLMDTRPRDLSPEDMARLRDLRDLAVREIQRPAD